MSGVKGRSGGRQVPGPGKKLGRPKGTTIYPDISTIIDELLFPCVCVAWRAQPQEFNKELLWFSLSATDLRTAYGKEGLAEFKKYFYLKKRGGCTVDGVGYKTTWRVKLGSYMLAKKLVESLGHTLSDLPNFRVPSEAMIERLNAAQERKDARHRKRDMRAGGISAHS